MAEIKEAMPAPQPEALDMPDDEVLYELADLFRVFGDSTRIKILYAPVSYTHLDVYKRQIRRSVRCQLKAWIFIK